MKQPRVYLLLYGAYMYVQIFHLVFRMIFVQPLRASLRILLASPYRPLIVASTPNGFFCFLPLS